MILERILVLILLALSQQVIAQQVPKICTANNETCRINQKIYEQIYAENYLKYGRSNEKAKSESAWVLEQLNGKAVDTKYNGRKTFPANIIIFPESERPKIYFDKSAEVSKDPLPDFSANKIPRKVGYTRTADINDDGVIPTYEVVAYRRNDLRDTFFEYTSPIQMAIRRVDSADDSIYWVTQNSSFDRDYSRSFESKSPPVGQPVARKKGEYVKLTDHMSCRSTPDFVKQNQANTIVMIPKDTQGKVLDTAFYSEQGKKRVIGYEIAFDILHDEILNGDVESDDNKLKCFIWYGGVVEGGEVKREVEEQTKKLPADKRICQVESCENDNLNVISQSDQKKYDDKIMKISKELDIDPAFLKASIMVETSFKYKTNFFEKKLYHSHLFQGTKINNYLKVYKWGKGCGMFGAENAHRYGIAWFDNLDEVLALSPELCTNKSKSAAIKKAYKERVLKKQKNPTYQLAKLCPEKEINHNKRKKLGYYYLGETSPKGGSLRLSAYSEEGCVRAKAKFMKELMNCPSSTIPKSSPAKAMNYRVTSEREQQRIAIAAYNGGCGRITSAFKDYFKKYKQWPSTYAQIAPFIAQSKPLNVCHVQKSLGLCSENESYYDIFRNEFKGSAPGARSERARKVQ